MTEHTELEKQAAYINLLKISLEVKDLLIAELTEQLENCEIAFINRGDYADE